MDNPSEEKKKLDEEKQALFQQNIAALKERPPISSLKNLDSSIKKNSSFIKKLKQLSEEQKDSLIAELKQLNLTRYISEAVTALCEAKLRPNDINAAVEVCSVLHQRYSDFTSLLLPALYRQCARSSDPTDSSRLSKRRVTLRFVGELFLRGVWDSPDGGGGEGLKKVLTDAPKDPREGEGLGHLLLLVSFLRALGGELLGLQGHPPPFVMPSTTRAGIISSLQSFCRLVTAWLLEEAKDLRAKERENHALLETKGELPEKESQAYERQRKAFDKLHTNVQTLAELLGMELPELPEDTQMTRIDISVAAVHKVEVTETLSVFDDEDTRSFYECLPDLRAFVPGVLLGDTEKEEKKEEKKDEKKDEKKEEKKEEEKKSEEKEANKVSDVQGEEKEKDEKEKPKEDDKEEKEEKEETKTSQGGLEVLLQRLPQCVNRDLIDQAAAEFCYVNSKSARKRLVKTLFNVHRTSLSLLPYYSRLVATLQQYMKDIGPPLVAMLEEEFHALVAKKDQMNIETKLRNIRFIGELTKFRVMPAGETLTLLKVLLDDFVHHNVDMACALLETAGRWLVRTPETHIRTKHLLEMLLRLKHSQNLGNRLDFMVENAYYHCLPPDRPQRQVKTHPPLQLFISKLILKDLNRSTAKSVLKLLRKLPWEDPMVEGWVLHTLLRVHRGKYGNIPWVASLVAGLASSQDRSQDFLVVKLVDELLERIRRGLEEGSFKAQQRHVMEGRLLGELYNYCVVESPVIFETLHLALSLPEVDPSDWFRVRWICTLLLTCGSYFDRGSSKRRLDRVLLLLERFVASKGPVPLETEFLLSDCFETLRPQYRRCTSDAEISEKLRQLESAESQVPGDSLAPEGEKEDKEEKEEKEEKDEKDTREREEKEEEKEEREEESDTSESSESSGESWESGESETEEPYDRTSPSDAAELDAMLVAMQTESLSLRRSEAGKVGKGDLPLPISLLRQSAKTEGHPSPPPSEEGSVPVQVVLRKGTKVGTKALLVPRSAPLVRPSLEAQTSALVEREEMKRLVLQYEAESQPPPPVPDPKLKGRAARQQRILHTTHQRRQ